MDTDIHIFKAFCVPRKRLIEGIQPIKHFLHVSNLGCVPATDWGIAGPLAEKKPIECGDSRGVPILNGAMNSVGARAVVRASCSRAPTQDGIRESGIIEGRSKAEAKQ